MCALGCIPFFVQLPFPHPKSLETSYLQQCCTAFLLRKWLPDAGVANPNISLLWAQSQRKRITAWNYYPALLARMGLRNYDTEPEVADSSLVHWETRNRREETTKRRKQSWRRKRVRGGKRGWYMDQAIFSYFLNLDSLHFYMIFPQMSVMPFSSAHHLSSLETVL